MADAPQTPTGKKPPTKAVALGYELKKDPAPKVLASGEGLIAEQIVKIAEEHGIHIHTDANLVEVLSALEVNEFIPLEAYAAVAEVLSYLYKQNKLRSSDPE